MENREHENIRNDELSSEVLMRIGIDHLMIFIAEEKSQKEVFMERNIKETVIGEQRRMKREREVVFGNDKGFLGEELQTNVIKDMSIDFCEQVVEEKVF